MAIDHSKPDPPPEPLSGRPSPSNRPSWDTSIPGPHPSFTKPVTQEEIEDLRQLQPFAEEARKRRAVEERELASAVCGAPDPIPEPDGPLIYENDGGTRIYEGALDDLRLGLLFKLGMPDDCERMLARCPGINYGYQFADYSVELFGISPADVMPNEVVMGTIGGKLFPFWPQTLERRLLAVDGGRDKYFGVWLSRIRCAKTPLTLEQAWFPQRGWQTLIDAQRLPVAAQKFGWKSLIAALAIPVLEQGAIFPLPVESKGGRSEDSGLVPKDQESAILEKVIENGRAIYADGRNEVSKHLVAKSFGGLYGIKGSDDSTCIKCAGCQAIDRLIKEVNFGWNWRDNILPRIKELQS